MSVHWLECFEGLSKPRQLQRVRQLIRLQKGRNGRLAELHVGSTKQYVHDELDGVRFVNRPLAAEDTYTDDPSHSEILGLPPADSPEAELIGDMIAECITAIHPAVEEKR